MVKCDRVRKEFHYTIIPIPFLKVAILYFWQGSNDSALTFACFLINLGKVGKTDYITAFYTLTILCSR